MIDYIGPEKIADNAELGSKHFSFLSWRVWEMRHNRALSVTAKKLFKNNSHPAAPWNNPFISHARLRTGRYFITDIRLKVPNAEDPTRVFNPFSHLEMVVEPLQS